MAPNRAPMAVLTREAFHTGQALSRLVSVWVFTRRGKDY